MGSSVETGSEEEEEEDTAIVMEVPVMAAGGMDMVRVRPTAAEGTILNNWRTML